MRRLNVLAWLICFLNLAPPVLAGQTAVAMPSLQSFTGIWDMPTARVLPDWHMRVKYGKAEPYRYYGVAVGFFDRFEIHGQFTEISTLQGFPGYDYGYYKDRNAGGRLVVFKEKNWLPQLAVGAYDPIGTSLFPSRYLVASKLINNVDFTLGLGQGLLGGEDLTDINTAMRSGNGTSDDSFHNFDTTFLLSSPIRPTKIFGGAEYHFSDKLTFSAEYTSMKYEGMYGTPDKAKIPINVGVKYRPTRNIYLEASYMRGNKLAIGISADFPLSPEGILPWKKEKNYHASERKRWQAYQANNKKLARLVGNELHDDGFRHISVAASSNSLWIELQNSKYLSNPRAMGRIERIADELSPPRVKTFYISLLKHGQVISSLKSSRDNLRAFIDSRTDSGNFLTFADLQPYDTAHYNDFKNSDGYGHTWHIADSLYSFEINPKIKTFLNNKNGFFKEKVTLQPRLIIYPWRQAALHSELEFTLYNEWDTVDFAPLEKYPTATDINEYGKRSRPRVSMLALEQYFQLPAHIAGRAALGAFETSYAGGGGELFRYFKNDRLGIGVESEWVRKRDPDNNFRLHPTNKHNYQTAFLNLYGLLWPSQGLEAGLKIGRFLGGDKGFRAEIRRSFKYFTMGAWYTATDTSNFSNPKNIGNRQKGVYIRVPLSIFSDHDIPGRLSYYFSSFTRDPGQLVEQPTSIYPMDSFDSLDHSIRHLNDMRN